MTHDDLATHWRDRVREKHRAQTIALSDDAATPPADDVSWAEAERRNWLETARTFDPRASLPEELLLRLVGDTASRAALNVEWGGLLKPLQAAVSAAAKRDVGLELAGFSKGSSVLHFRAVVRESVDLVMDGSAVTETPLAQPARELLDAIESLEAGQDMHRWISMFEGVERLTSELDKLHLQADFRWCSRGGSVRRAYLSERGIQFAKELAETRESEVTKPIGGMVTELHSSGHVKIKAGSTRRSPTWSVRVEPDTLTAMRLVLGQWVNWTVAKISSEDRLGRVKSVEYAYRGDSESGGFQEQIPGFTTDTDI